jgi:hypothetical protein
MTGSDTKFYIRLGAVALTAIALMFIAKVLFFPSQQNPFSRTGLQPTEAPSKPGTRTISWQDAAQHYGEYCTVEGTIVAAHNSGKACFLNFHSNYNRYLTAVIFANRFGAFPPSPEQYYQGKRVRVTGEVKQYQGKPEIVLESPDQIQILD